MEQALLGPLTAFVFFLRGAFQLGAVHAGLPLHHLAFLLGAGGFLEHTRLNQLQDVFQVLVVEDAHDEQGIEELDERDKEELGGAPNGVSRVKAALFHGFRQHLHGLGLQDVQRELRAVLVALGINADKTRGGKLHPRPEGGAEADAREPVPLVLTREEGDALGLLGHGDDELAVHHEPGGGVGTEVDVDQQVVVAGAQQAGHVLVLDGVEQLRFVHVAAQGVGHPVVPERAHGRVEPEGVVVELQQLLLLGQLQYVHGSGGGTR